MTTWTPEAQLLAHLDDAVPAILASQKADGRFGTEPWISTDQNVLLSLAAAWSLPASRHHHSDVVLDAIARGGTALAEAADADGMWEFRKKDGSEWGPIRMPWVYSRWMRARALVGAHLTEAAREAWDGGLQLGFDGIASELATVEELPDGPEAAAAAREAVPASQGYRFVRIHNIPAHHAMALFCAGQVFERPDWRERAVAYLYAVAAAQSEHGWWAEHAGPVVAYNFVYVEALGTYYAMSGDEAALPPLARAARYHAEFTYPDGSAVETVDGRNPYHTGVRLGNCGFAHTPAGRGWLARQHGLFLDGGGVFDADYAASLLLYGGDGGPAEPPAAARDTHVFRMGELAITARQRPWFACLSAIVTEIPPNRWGQDRQNFLSLYHDDAGLLLGGGDTKLQPLWSSFTVGDPALLAHIPGDEDPDFSPRPGLRHVPDAAQLGVDDAAPSVTLHYGPARCRLQVLLQAKGQARIQVAAEGADGPAAAHLTLLADLGQRLRHADGREIELGDAQVDWELGAGEWIEHGGWRLLPPPGSRCRWPVLPHNPYRKDGHATIDEARLVVTVPLPDAAPREVVVRIL